MSCDQCSANSCGENCSVKRAFAAALGVSSSEDENWQEIVAAAVNLCDNPHGKVLLRHCITLEKRVKGLTQIMASTRTEP